MINAQPERPQGMNSLLTATVVSGTPEDTVSSRSNIRVASRMATLEPWTSGAPRIWTKLAYIPLVSSGYYRNRIYKTIPTCLSCGCSPPRRAFHTSQRCLPSRPSPLPACRELRCRLTIVDNIKKQQSWRALKVTLHQL